MKRIAALLIGMLFSFASLAAPGPLGYARRSNPACWLVTGWAMIEPDGSVGRLDLDQREKLEPGVVSLIEKARQQWKFEPALVDGVARKAKARMSLRIVAKNVEADLYAVSIRSGYFGEEAMTPEEYVARADSIKPLSMKPPAFPPSAARQGARGTVYLVMKVGREGVLQEVFAEQVHLRIVGSEIEMARLRYMFAESAMEAAKAWRFH